MNVTVYNLYVLINTHSHKAIQWFAMYLVYHL